MVATSSLLCSSCHTAPLAYSAVAVATGVCSDCAPPLPTLRWDWITRGNGIDHLHCNWHVRCLAGAEGAVEIAPGHYARRLHCELSAERSRSAGETTYTVDVIGCGAHPDGDALGEIEWDLHCSRRRYQGTVVDPTAVAFVRAREAVTRLEAEHEPAGFRPGAVEALGLGVCPCGDDLAIECKRCNAQAVSL